MEVHLSIQDNQKITGYTVTEKMHQKKKHLIVPVTMIVEGVLAGSAGPLLHLAEEFGKFPESWNGIPVVINHPEVDGLNVSANSPDLIETATVGRVYNAKMVKSKLKAEVWLEEAKLGEVSPDVLSAIGLKQTIEVSVGVFTDYEETPGIYNEKEYKAIARNHRPDHLALLPGGIGACSIADGCGIRVNSKNQNEKGGKSVDRIEAIQVLKDSGQFIQEIGANMAQGLKEKLDELYNLVRSLNVPSDTSVINNTYNYLEEAYDTYLIYTVENGKDSKTFKQNYQFNVTSGEPEFVGDAVEVEKKIEYKPIEVNFVRTKINKEVVIMSDEKKCTPCIEKKATELIANKATKFTEADRGWLETFEEVQLDKMVPETLAQAGAMTPDEMLAKGHAMLLTDPIAGAAMIKKAKALLSKVVTPTGNEDVDVIATNAVSQLSAEDKASLDFGKRVLAARKAEMTKGIQANTVAGTWSEEDLVAMSESMLEKVYKSVVKEDLPVDYSLNGNVKVQVNTSEIAPLIPNTVN